MNELTLLVGNLQKEYEQAKNDPKKLELFQIKKENYLQKIKQNGEMVKLAIENISKINHTEKPKPIIPVNKKINHLLPPAQVNQMFYQDKTTFAPEDLHLKSQFVKFSCYPPLKWLKDYQIERITIPDASGVCQYQIKLDSVKSSDLQKKTNNQYHLILYLFNQSDKKIIILFTDGDNVSTGNVICARNV